MAQMISAADRSSISGASAGELAAQVELALSKSRQTQRPFFVVLVQIEHLEDFRRRHSLAAAQKLLRDVHTCVRKAVHASQYVGIARNGVGIVFDAAEPGQVDLISRRLVALCQNLIRTGGYNNPSTRWSDVLFQLLVPGGGKVLSARSGWAIYPRDGNNGQEILQRAWAHLRHEQAR